ncbi:ABC transporter substrate-binding protein [Pseudomonas flexibilis]|uniref:Amino acid ABC transporter substrate-binding protein, PAAT family n=2 Tax=Pseudomonas TaxID=286 RepID=A0A1N6S306_9PSED|nr:ABC transporter substrate-binding protein [Pseudomonas flexibilis]SIQ35474.1 amino acid ABC transporter substrate-binding protein, PAAT family [Pseudomonas flexibilis]
MKRHTIASLLLVGLLALLPVLAGANTLERVRMNNTFTLGYLPDLAPFSSETGGTVSGYGIELCLKIADRVKAELGLSNMQVRYKAVSRGEVIGAIQSGAIDIFCTPTPETLASRKEVSFSRPVYTAGLAVVVRTDAQPQLIRALSGEPVHTGPTWRATINQGLANHTYATIEGGISEEWARDRMRKLGVIATLVTVDSHAQGIELVAERKADAFFGERMLLQTDLRKSAAADQMQVLDTLFGFTPVSFPLERGDEDFRLLVDTVISELYRSGEIERAHRKYLGELREGAELLFPIYALP